VPIVSFSSYFSISSTLLELVSISLILLKIIVATF